MKLIDRYLGFEWMKWFALSMSFLFAILFLQAFSDNFEFFSKFIDPSGRKEALAWVLGYMPWVLPISCFIATVSVLGIFSKNHELLAMRASGVSTFAVSKPLLLLGLLVSFASWFARDSQIQLVSGKSGKESPLVSFGMKIGQSGSGTLRNLMKRRGRVEESKSILTIKMVPIHIAFAQIRNLD